MARFFPDEDLTGNATSGWNGSLTAYVHPKTQARPVPDALRAQLAGYKADKRERMDVDAVWFGLEENTRVILITFCTDRPIEGAQRVRWSQLTAGQQEAISLFMRKMQRASAVGAGLW